MTDASLFSHRLTFGCVSTVIIATVILEFKVVGQWFIPFYRKQDVI